MLKPNIRIGSIVEITNYETEDQSIYFKIGCKGRVVEFDESRLRGNESCWQKITVKIDFRGYDKKQFIHGDGRWWAFLSEVKVLEY